MSIVHTAEDFAGASFARHACGGKAVRFDATTDRPPWQIGMFGKSTDEDMALHGWVPVVEATEVMQNRQIDAEAHLDQIARLSKRAAAAGDQIESQRIVIEDLQEENGRLERILQAPLSLKDLEVAWEAAEEADECREGDVLIERYPNRSWHVYRAESMLSVCRDVRILSRAPRQPWQDLADVLGDFAIADEHSGRRDDAGLARALHERGVRVTGGDDDE